MTHTIFQVLSLFQEANPSANMKAVRSVIHRFLAEHWGGEAPKGSKATSDETSALTDLLKTLPATMLVETMSLLEQEFIKKEIPKENSKSYRYAYKKFFDWAENNGYFKKTQEKDNELTTQEPLFSNYNTKNRPKSIRHKQVAKKTYALMSTHGNDHKNKGKLIYANDYINPSLAQQLKLFNSFRQEKNNVSKGTMSVERQYIYRILGWLHRYKNIPLEELSLTKIIYFTKLNLAINDFKNKRGKVDHEKFILEKSIARQKGIDLANENIILVEEYLDFVGGHPRSREKVVAILIAVATFVYKNEIGKDEYINANELPIVKRLKQLSYALGKLAKNTPDVVPHEDKSVSWSEATNLLKLLRKRADCLFFIYERKNTKVYSTIKCKRTSQSVINDLQMFLSLAFMLLIPTDRARTYYELEIGRTFKFGLQTDNKFIPVNKLSDKTQALWYIHLLPDDYKTGKHYKEYWGVMPNVLFEDGKKLYDYIDTWINEGREYKQKCNHNCFFRGIRDYEPLDSSDWWGRTTTMFKTETHVPVSPKEIRKMYITWINNLGATHAQLKSAATAMHHSQKMQESVYNSQTVLDRVAPIMASLCQNGKIVR